MWRKGGRNRLIANALNDLIDFGHVPMTTNPIGSDRFIAFWIMEFKIGFSPSTGDTCFRIDNNGCGFDEVLT